MMIAVLNTMLAAMSKGANSFNEKTPKLMFRLVFNNYKLKTKCENFSCFLSMTISYPSFNGRVVSFSLLKGVWLSLSRTHIKNNHKLFP